MKQEKEDKGQRRPLQQTFSQWFHHSQPSNISRISHQFPPSGCSFPCHEWNAIHHQEELSLSWSFQDSKGRLDSWLLLEDQDAVPIVGSTWSRWQRDSRHHQSQGNGWHHNISHNWEHKMIWSIKEEKHHWLWRSPHDDLWIIHHCRSETMRTKKKVREEQNHLFPMIGTRKLIDISLANKKWCRWNLIPHIKMMFLCQLRNSCWWKWKISGDCRENWRRESCEVSLGNHDRLFSMKIFRSEWMVGQHNCKFKQHFKLQPHTSLSRHTTRLWQQNEPTICLLVEESANCSSSLPSIIPCLFFLHADGEDIPQTSPLFIMVTIEGFCMIFVMKSCHLLFVVMSGKVFTLLMRRTLERNCS